MAEYKREVWFNSSGILKGQRQKGRSWEKALYVFISVKTTVTRIKPSSCAIFSRTFYLHAHLINIRAYGRIDSFIIIRPQIYKHIHYSCEKVSSYVCKCDVFSIPDNRTFVAEQGSFLESYDGLRDFCTDRLLLACVQVSALNSFYNS